MSLNDSEVPTITEDERMETQYSEPTNVGYRVVVQFLVLEVGSLTVFFFFEAEDGIRDLTVTGVQTCALPISAPGVRWRAVATWRGEARMNRRDMMRVLGGALALPLLAALPAERLDALGRAAQDRKSVVEGKRGDLGGRRII